MATAEIQQIKQLGAVARAVVEKQKERQSHPELYQPLPTGLEELDRALNGYDKGWYVSVGGDAKSGKTTFLQHLATQFAATHRIIMWYVPLEERDEAIAIRSMSRLSTTIQRSDFRNLKITEEGFYELDKLVQELEQLPFYISEATMSIARLYELIKHAPEGKKPDIVAVDYLQLFQDWPGKSMAERSDAISSQLMKIRNELGVGILAAFQLGKGGKKQYGGTSVYRDADVIIHINQKKDAVTGKEFEKLLEVTIMPSRHMGQARLEVIMNGAHSRIQTVRMQVPDYLLNPHLTEMELADEPYEPFTREYEN